MKHGVQQNTFSNCYPQRKGLWAVGQRDPSVEARIVNKAVNQQRKTITIGR